MQHQQRALALCHPPDTVGRPVDSSWGGYWEEGQHGGQTQLHVGQSWGFGSPNNVGSPLIALAQDVKQEQVHIVVQRLVVQEQLGEVAQVLAVHALLLAIDLEHAHTAVPTTAPGGC